MNQYMKQKQKRTVMLLLKIHLHEFQYFIVPPEFRFDAKVLLFEISLPHELHPPSSIQPAKQERGVLTVFADWYQKVPRPAARGHERAMQYLSLIADQILLSGLIMDAQPTNYFLYCGF